MRTLPTEGSHELIRGSVNNERLKVSIDFALKSTEGFTTSTNCHGTLDAPSEKVTRAPGASIGR